jgi:hypothetical protein
MHGIGLDADVREWFGERPHNRRKGARQRTPLRAATVPATTVPRDLIERSLG